MARRVVVYGRVSTEHEAQLSALDNQIQYYDDLLLRHPDWELVERYIDEGITGTSIKKRKRFIKMIEDAKSGKFDLIITREVSRFARNTIDTLHHTRELKKYGVEVYFSEDNIWTMNDEDGELRLTIMATLAQNESKKTSMRVKSGQAISFQNAVPYGNGNILGYDKVGKELVINEEQAKTVRIIFDLYLEGKGIRLIKFELEKMGRLTATGNTNWTASAVSRILNNPFYSGTIIYRKEIVPDYLEQKKVRNYDLVNKVVIEGNHTPIITKEEFQQVQERLQSKIGRQVSEKRRGKKISKSLWCTKLRCSCGVGFNRQKWHKTNEGEIQYAYRCYNQLKTGSVFSRQKKGLSIEGVCDSQIVQGWKIELMSSFLFESFWKDKKEILRIANEMIGKYINDNPKDDNQERLESIESDIEKYQNRLENLIDMRMGGEITKEIFMKKKVELEKKINVLQDEASKYIMKENADDSEYDNKIRVLQYALEQEFDFSKKQIPEEIIDAFVKKVIVYKDHFEWYLSFDEGVRSFQIHGDKRNKKLGMDMAVDIPQYVPPLTGGT